MQRRGSAAALKAKSAIQSELNLTPIMSLLVILIPVILLTFNFFEVKVHAVHAPRHNTAGKPPTDKPLKATLFVETDAVRISASSLEAPIRVPVKDDGSLDLKTVAKHMQDIKAAHPKEEKVFVGASAGVHWQKLAGAMDVVRVPLPGKDGKAVKGAKPLFGQVILVTE